MSTNPTAADRTTIEVEAVTVEHDSGGSVVTPLLGFSMLARAGELLVLLGPSGCGTSTMLSVLAGLRQVISGQVRVAGVEVTALPRADLDAFRESYVGFVFRSPKLIRSLSAVENAAVPLLVRGVPRQEALAAAGTALQQVGFSGLADDGPAALTSRQQQQVAVARALVTDPPVLLVDEPTETLDHIAAESSISLLRTIADAGRTVVVATHDPRFSPIADQTINMVPELAGSLAPPILVELAAGETLYRQGSRGDRVFVLHEGEVEVLDRRADGGEELLTTRSAPEIVGEMGPLLGFPRSATVRARTPVRATSYSATDFERLAQPWQPAENPTGSEAGDSAKAATRQPWQPAENPTGSEAGDKAAMRQPWQPAENPTEAGDSAKPRRPAENPTDDDPTLIAPPSDDAPTIVAVAPDVPPPPP